MLKNDLEVFSIILSKNKKLYAQAMPAIFPDILGWVALRFVRQSLCVK